MLGKKRRCQLVQIAGTVAPRPYQTYEKRRHRSTQKEVEKQSVDPVKQADLHLDVRLMLEVLGTVNPKMATVLTMEMAGYPEPEIAAGLQVSRPTVARLKSSGHTILRCLFANYFRIQEKS